MSTLQGHIAHCRAVYRYYREQGFSPDDARAQVGAYSFAYYGRHG
jgi:hypothetical protein